MRVWLIDDHALIREGVRGMIERSGAHTVVRESGSIADARDAAPAIHCELVVLDLTLPDGDGVSFLKELQSVRADLPVLALTMHSTQDRVLGSLEAGASGYLVKSASEEDLLAAVETVGNGGTYIHPDVTPYVLQTFREPQSGGAESSRESVLKERDLEVLRYLAEGMNNSQMARECAVSVSTIKSHVSKLLDYFDATDRANLVFEAMKSGALTEDQS